MGFQQGKGYVSLSTCPGCGARSLDVIESRSTKNATRRRKQCHSCGHRCTTYEVSSAWYQYAEDNARLRAALLKQLNLQSPLTLVPSAPLPCETCSLSSSSSCSLGLPEFQTSEASDCIHFKPCQTGDNRYIA